MDPGSILGVLVLLLLSGAFSKSKSLPHRQTYGTPIGPAFWKGGVKLRFKWKSEEDIILILSLCFSSIMLFAAGDATELPAMILLASPFLLATFLMFWHAHIIIVPRLATHPWFENTKPFTPGETESRKLARSYRKLAKKYHPDLARTLPQKIYFERMMKMVNKAYVEKNMKTLLRLFPDAGNEEDVNSSN